MDFAGVSHSFIPHYIAALKTRFTSVGEEMTLVSVLRRLASGQEVNHYISRLVPEAHSRNTCTLHLHVHAETQLLKFYDNNPWMRPSFRCIRLARDHVRLRW